VLVTKEILWKSILNFAKNVLVIYVNLFIIIIIFSEKTIGFNFVLLSVIK